MPVEAHRKTGLQADLVKHISTFVVVRARVGALSIQYFILKPTVGTDNRLTNKTTKR